MVNLIALTEQQAGHILFKDQFAYALLRPQRITDGRYVVSEAALTQPEHAAWRHVLALGSIVDSATVTFVVPSDYYVTISGTLMNLYIGGTRPELMGYPAPRLFDFWSDDVYRFECHYDNDPESRDRPRLRRRVELLQYSPAGYQSGDTIWAAWSTIITDKREGFDAAATTLIQQWHQHPSSGISPPPMATVLHGGMLTINNRSGDGVTNDQVYAVPAPVSWKITHFVIQGTLGQFGHLRIWVNGEKVCDKDTNIGYYNESLPYLIRLQNGVYMDNVRSVDALYHANIAFGFSDLSARINTPVALSGPTGWLDEANGGAFVYYPGADVYPATNMYPS